MWIPDWFCGTHLVRDCIYVAEQEQQNWSAEIADLLLSMAQSVNVITEWRNTSIAFSFLR